MEQITMPPQIKQAKLETLEAIIKEVEGELEIQKQVQEKAKEVVAIGRARVAGMVADKYTRIGKIDALSDLLTKLKAELGLWSKHLKGKI